MKNIGSYEEREIHTDEGKKRGGEASSKASSTSKEEKENKKSCYAVTSKRYVPKMTPRMRYPKYKESV